MHKGNAMKRTPIVFALLLLLASHAAFAVGALYVRPLRSSVSYGLMTMKQYDATTTIENQVATTTVEITTSMVRLMKRFSGSSSGSRQFVR